MLNSMSSQLRRQAVSMSAVPSGNRWESTWHFTQRPFNFSQNTPMLCADSISEESSKLKLDRNAETAGTMT